MYGAILIHKTELVSAGRADAGALFMHNSGFFDYVRPRHDCSQPLPRRWPELRGRTFVTVDFAYGGTLYCVVAAEELGFHYGLADVNFTRMKRESSFLTTVIQASQTYSLHMQHPESPDTIFLYSVIIVDMELSGQNLVRDCLKEKNEAVAEETGPCFSLISK